MLQELLVKVQYPRSSTLAQRQIRQGMIDAGSVLGQQQIKMSQSPAAKTFGGEVIHWKTNNETWWSSQFSNFDAWTAGCSHR